VPVPSSYPCPTRLVVLRLKTSLWVLVHMMRRGLLLPPPKDDRGRFLWYRKHVDKARRLLAERRARRQGLR
jgi:hypothetical protein